MDAQPYRPLSGQHGVERVPYEPFCCASDKARIRKAITFTMRTENGISPRPPTIIDSIFGDHKYVREGMLNPGIDEIARVVGGTPLTIQLLIRWPGFPERYFEITMPTEPPEADSRAELHYRIGGAYTQYFNAATDENWQSTEPDWDMGSPRTDVRMLTVVALWHCGGDVFQADVDCHEAFPMAPMVWN
ncbi:uncharacterized protein TRAVEDRAFT_49895 [Trametes versicolor FP-101664 SS1]|uniref:uncharacterized protein n=1 Tax=Trametes versicolor (strain FP-101664) TaxID=717944 RepID=UPI0004622FA1|nr:uncharacterized protein TRAVEDRAFT_49895 [Trametes versicolor FP-101664 SS1]EIW57085.1 hypothetical protein TRAVEDRAFT_49895 [Trametes versicolor FP-101664 SS1]